MKLTFLTFKHKKLLFGPKSSIYKAFTEPQQLHGICLFWKVLGCVYIF